jgi:hypothetical protein
LYHRKTPWPVAGMIAPGAASACLVDEIESELNVSRECCVFMK